MLTKKIKPKFIIIFVVIIIFIVLVICGINKQNQINQEKIEKKNTLISEITNISTEQGFENVEVKTTSEGDAVYDISIIASNLDSLSYEDIYRANREITSGKILNITYYSNNDTYKIYDTFVMKNDDIVWEKTDRYCIECSNDALYSYQNPFSGEIEKYCSYHYDKLQEKYSELGIDF